MSTFHAGLLSCKLILTLISNDTAVIGRQCECNASKAARMGVG